ncbi:hypothetical protein M0813_19106 [Anaeramoeba flamelloides]|uniref:Uncharacterized protein n=1 Tax=Anaeramoeba flamelloides TaxID=1746091 RepID=A0ABQ8YPB0_9EUKA|nr:hypothetical protein M0813_19106 [Anaeramoeba flamelloides]
MIIETNELNESIEQNINNDTNYKQIIDELRSKRSQIEDYLFDIETISKIHQRLKRQRDFRNDNKSEIMHTLEKLLKICSLKDLGEIIFILFEELSDLEKKNSNNRDTTRLQNKNFKKIKNIVNYLILHKKNLFMDIFMKYTISIESNYFWYKYEAKLMPYIMAMVKIRLVNFFLLYLKKNHEKIKKNENIVKFEILRNDQLTSKQLTKLSKTKEFTLWFKEFSFNTMKTWSLVPFNNSKLINQISKPSELINDLLDKGNIRFIRSKDLQIKNKINYGVQQMKDNDEYINLQLNKLI